MQVTFHKYIQEATGFISGLSGGVLAMNLTPQMMEFLTAVVTAFVCGVVGAFGGYLVKRWTKKRLKDGEQL